MLPKVTGHCPVWNSRWIDELTIGESIQVPKLLAKIVDLKTKGLTGIGMAFNFLNRRVQPLQLRHTWGYEYSGLNDLSRMSPEEISTDEVMERLGRMFKNVEDIPKVVGPFNASDLPREHRTFEQAGASSGASKCPAEDELDASLAPLPRRIRTAVVKRRVSRSLRIVKDAPPPVITFEEGQDPEVRVRLSLYSNATTIDHGFFFLQAADDVVETTKTTADTVPTEVLAAGEDINVGDDREPPAAELNPAVPSKENSAPASEAGATSFVAVLMRDVISSLRDVVVPAPEPAIPIVLPKAVPVENPPTSEVLDMIPLNAADPGVSELEASWTLEAVATAAGTSSEAGTSGGRELVSVPSIRSESPMEGLLRPEEIQTFESPKLDPQTVATILEMNLHLINHSRRNAQFVWEHGESLCRIEVLEKQLAEERLQSSRLVMKFDSTAASFQAERQEFMSEKDHLVAHNKSLYHKTKEYKNQETVLKNSVTVWKNAFYQLTD
uniref:Uncharacterized protein n=1 Tax=Setaria viridis TaxID=4556 RepID=A0A4U6V9J6_SETVI|nr:hypothetical protein SEVIR_4G095600v2 [Setaria viridis]